MPRFMVIMKGDERVLGEVLGQPHVPDHAAEACDQPGRLDPPDRLDRSMGRGSRHAFRLLQASPSEAHAAYALCCLATSFRRRASLSLTESGRFSPKSSFS